MMNTETKKALELRARSTTGMASINVLRIPEIVRVGAMDSRLRVSTQSRFRSRNELQLGVGHRQCAAAARSEDMKRPVTINQGDDLMKPMQLTVATLTALLISSTLWSCNTDTTPSEPAAALSAQEQQAPTMPSGMLGTGGMMDQPSGMPGTGGMMDQASGMPGTGGGMMGQASGTPGTGDEMMDQLRAGCPMVVQGADVTVADTDSGVALTFTTDAGDVVDLRARVRNMGQMYGMHRGRGMGGGGGRGMGSGGGRGMGGGGGRGMGSGGGRGMGGGGGRGMGGGGMDGRGPMPAASNTVTDIDNGARLELRPTDPSQLDALREHVRWHQERMQSGACWMLQGEQE
jgi:hypothetical protein